MRTYPTTTSNANVPKDVYLLAETSTMSGEIVTTYYATQDLELFAVVDWKGDKPLPVALFEICRVTGDTEQMLLARIKDFFYYKERI
jgi:hypothetical protein